MYDLSEIFYSLCIEDIQTVADESLGRPLTDAEIDMVKDEIADRIAWYDAIDYVITARFGEASSEFDDDDNRLVPPHY